MSLVSMVHGSTWWKLPLDVCRWKPTGRPTQRWRLELVFSQGDLGGWPQAANTHIYFSCISIYMFIQFYTYIYNIYMFHYQPLLTIISFFTFQFWVPWQCWTSGWIGWGPGSKAVKAPARARLPNFKHSKPTTTLVPSLLETNGILSHIYILNHIYIYNYIYIIYLYIYINILYLYDHIYIYINPHPRQSFAEESKEEPKDSEEKKDEDDDDGQGLQGPT